MFASLLLYVLLLNYKIAQALGKFLGVNNNSQKNFNFSIPRTSSSCNGIATTWKSSYKSKI